MQYFYLLLGQSKYPSGFCLTNQEILITEVNELGDDWCHSRHERICLDSQPDCQIRSRKMGWCGYAVEAYVWREEECLVDKNYKKDNND